MEVSTPDRETPVKWIYHSCVKWEIENFFYRRLDRNDPIESPEFQTNFGIPVKWRLILRVREKSGDKYITGIRLWQSGSCDNLLSPYVTARLSLKHGGHKIYGPVIGNFEFNQSLALNFILFPIDGNIGSHFEEKSTNSCQITIQCDMFFNTSYSSHWLSTDKNLNSLSNDLSNFDLVGKLGDLDLKVDGRRNPVHSTIVKLRSPCVARLLAQKPDDNVIDLSGKCTQDELKVMIRYWYTGNLHQWPVNNFQRASAVFQRMEQDELMQYYASETILLTTTFKKLNISVTWSIEDDNFFLQLGMLDGEVVTKYEFGQQSWKLNFYPKGENGAADHLSLCVEEKGETSSTHRAYSQIFFIDCNDKERCHKNTVSKLDSPGKYVFSNFMTHSEFGNLRATLLSGNKLRIGCRMEYGTGEFEGYCKPKDVSNSEGVEATKHPYEILSDNLKDLWETREMGNVTLETEGGKTLRAHSAILAARSRYFEFRLTEPKWIDSKNIVIKQQDIKKEDLELILKYMYHAEINLNLELAQKLYPSVHKYRIKVLEVLCSEYLQSHLTNECVLNVLLMADKCQDSPLKTTTLEFVVKNFVQISETEEWRSFRNTNRKLAAEINQRLLVQSISE